MSQTLQTPSAVLRAERDAFLSACIGPDPDVTRLQWASAFLAEIDGNEGVVSEAARRSDDPTAFFTAWCAICDLVRELRAECEKAGGAP